MSRNTAYRLRRLSATKLAVVAAVMVGAPAVLTATAQASGTQLSGTVQPYAQADVNPNLGDGFPTLTADSSVTSSYFQLDQGSTNDPTTSYPLGGYGADPTTFLENSEPDSIPDQYTVTPLYQGGDGTQGVELGTYNGDSDGNAGAGPGDILNPVQEPFDTDPFDVQTSQYTDPNADTGSAGHPRLWDTGDSGYTLDGITGDLVLGNLKSWTVNWYTGAGTFLYNQGADSSDITVASLPSDLNPTDAANSYIESLLIGTDTGAGEGTPDHNLVGVYDAVTGQIALEWSSVIDNNTSVYAEGFNGDFGVWNIVGTLS